jgi:hypothetical protein
MTQLSSACGICATATMRIILSSQVINRFQGIMKPLRLRAGVEWEQGLLGSALREGIPLARGTDGLSIGGEWPKIKLTKNRLG